jgi:hypothetical protein
LGSDSELNMTQEGRATIVGNSQEGHIQITMVASRQDSNAEVTSAERTSTKSPLPTHPAVILVRAECVGKGDFGAR